MLDFTKPQSRGDAVLAVRGASEDTVIFPLSSETPVMRWGEAEILVHSAEAVDLTFLNSGRAPLLDSHDRHSGVNKVIGVVIRAWLADKRLYVEARFSKREDAQEVLADVLDGIIPNVSVGYSVVEYERNEGSNPPSYRVTKWRPYEASFVPIPADESVGMGRSATVMETAMTQSALPAVPGQVAVPAAVVANAAERGAEIAASMDEINALAETHNQRSLADTFIRAAMTSGAIPSLAAFRGQLRAAVPADTPLVNSDIGLNVRETRQFSVLRLARAMADGATRADMEAASFEIEASGAARAQADAEGRKTSGAYTLPAELMRSWGSFEIDGVQSRAAIGTAAGGANILDTSHLADRFIDNLRNQSGIMRAGATLLTGLDNNVEIPGGQANNAAAWLASEDANVAESNPTFRKINLAPKDLGSYVDLTRRMLQQSTIALEAYVRKQITDGIMLEIDRAALYGTGATGQPTGVNATAGIGSVAFATAATTGIPTRDELIDMKKLIAATNRGTGGLNFIMNSSSVGDLQKTRVDAGSGIFLLNDDATRLLGAGLIESNQIAAGPTLNDIWLGYWADVIVGFWGSLDLDRDTAAKFLAGGIRLRGIQTVDVAVQRVGSFAKGT